MPGLGRPAVVGFGSAGARRQERCGALNGDCDEEGRSVLCGLDRHRAAKYCRPVTHPDESESAVRAIIISTRAKAPAIIFDDDQHVAFAAFDHDTRVSRMRVPRDVRQSLLDDSVQRRLHVWPQSALTVAALGVAGDVRLQCPFVHVCLDGCDESQIVEFGRA